MPITFPAEIKLSSLNGQNGFKIDGENFVDSSGYSLDAFDFNEDSYQDLIMGSFNSNGGPAIVYVVYGSATLGSGGSVRLADLNGSNGFKISGLDVHTAKSAGDINGDGHNDLILNNNRYGSENVYILFGGSGLGSGGLFSVESLNGNNGFIIVGDNSINGYCLGASVSSAGDINSDGYDDLIIASPQFTSTFPVGNSIGRSYVLFGKPGIASNGFFNVSTLDGINGFWIQGENPSDAMGSAVAGVTDVNGDGPDDIMITSPGPYGSNLGHTYIIFGHSGIGSGGSFNLTTLNGTNGFKVDGVIDFVGGIEDINGDGRNDLLFGHADPFETDLNAAYIVFGKTNLGSSGAINLSVLNGNDGFKIIGVNNAYSAGDINGDSYNDLIAATTFSEGCYTHVYSYVIFGGPNVGNNGMLDLTTLDGNNGFKFRTEDTSYGLRLSIGPGSDFNQDGRSDLLLAEPSYKDFQYYGRTYVVFSNGDFSLPAPGANIGAIVGGLIGGLLALPLGYFIYKHFDKIKSFFSRDKSKNDKPFELKPISPSRSEIKIELGFSLEWSELKFDEKEILRSDAYGTVYKGEYKSNEVAIRKFHSYESFEMVLPELKRQSGVLGEKEYLAQVHGVCLQSPGYMVMEFMPTTLTDFLQKNPNLSLDRLYRMGQDVATGLEQLHEKDFLHGHLSSSNILLDEDYHAKISDFGLSALKASEKNSPWMAPELFEEKSRATQKADIYACGMILWELIVRPYHIPFYQFTGELLRMEKLKQGAEQEVIPADCKPEFAKIIRDCWKNPKEQRPSAKELINSLSELLSQAALSDMPIASVSNNFS